MNLGRQFTQKSEAYSFYRTTPCDCAEGNLRLHVDKRLVLVIGQDVNINGVSWLGAMLVSLVSKPLIHLRGDMERK